MNSSIPRFYELTLEERRARIGAIADVGALELSRLSPDQGLREGQADLMVENAIGVLGLPLGVCVNMRLDGRDVLVPMAVEEPSVVAACSYAAKLLRAGGGVTSEVSDPLMVGQIQVLDVPDPAAAERAVLAAKAELLALADEGHERLCGAGGGARDVSVRHLPKMDANDPCGAMLIVHLLVDVAEAMGANAINSMCERLAPRIEDLTGGRVALRILSNLSDQRTVTVVGRVPLSTLDGKGGSSGRVLAERIEEASVFAERDPYRACTHNKGVMNGVDATLIALGQDWRAVEAGAHAHAARSGRYTAMAAWRVEGEFLVGRMTLPMAVGTVGGVAKVHPVVGVAHHIAKIESAAQLGALCAAAGLAQNLGALRALAAEGIQRGHMRLHARNVAVEAGADTSEVDEVARVIADLGRVNGDEAARVLLELRASRPDTTSRPDAVTAKAASVAGSSAHRAVSRLPGVGTRAISSVGAPDRIASGAFVIPLKRRPPNPPNGFRFLASLGASEPGASTIAANALPDTARLEMKDRSMSDNTRPETPISGKVLVTGAAGHLGANLTRRLLADGHEVRVLLRQGSNNSAVDGLDVEKVYGDLRDPASLREATRGCGRLFHAAAMVSTVEATPALEREIYECNVLGTRNILRAAQDASIERVVVTGSFSAVGYDLDDRDRPGNEDMPFWPFEQVFPYARTKVLVEHESLKACVEGLDVVIATSCAILGPNDHKPSRMGRTLLDYGKGKLAAYIPGGFDFVAADDIVQGHVLAMTRGRTGQKYIISTQYLELDDIMDIFEEVTGQPRPKVKLSPQMMAGVAEVSSFVLNRFFPETPQRFTPGAVRILRKRRHADTQKAQRELGFVPGSIRRAVHEAYADFARRGLAPTRPGTVGETAQADPTKRVDAPANRAATR